MVKRKKKSAVMSSLPRTRATFSFYKFVCAGFFFFQLEMNNHFHDLSASLIFKK